MKLYNLIILCFLYCLYSCGSKDDKLKIVHDVQFTEVGVRNIPLYHIYVGQVYGLSDIAILPRVDGWITGVHFKEGTQVTKGQLLYTIDDLPIQNKITAAKASIAEANSRLVKNKSDYGRVKPLAEMNALSKRQLDDALAAYNSSKSEVDIAKAQLRNAEIELGYTRILAPISGLIGMSGVSVGDYVTRTSQALNTVSNIQKVRVKFAITEDDYLEFYRTKKVNGDTISNKIPIMLTLSDGSAYSESGTLDIADREINPSTGSMMLQAIFNNDGKLLRPGQFVKVKVQTGYLTDAIIVPQSTVTQMQNVYQVVVLTAQNKMEVRIVEVGNRIGDNWVITKGLSKGERVVALGNQALIKSNESINPIDMKWNYDKMTTKPVK